MDNTLCILTLKRLLEKAYTNMY